MFSILVIACSLALDAVSVSVAGGIKTQKARAKDALKIALFFGAFHTVMPLIGWLIGHSVSDTIAGYSNWVGFVLLSAIGLKMIQEAFRDTSVKESFNIMSTKTLLMLSVAISIDALIVGITLPYLDLPPLASAFVIGLVTFILSFVGFIFGKKLGSFFEGKVEVIGGLALIAVGVKLLIT